MSTVEVDAGGDVLDMTGLASPEVRNIPPGTPLPMDPMTVDPNNADNFVEWDDRGLAPSTLPIPLLGGIFLDTSTETEQLIPWVGSDPDFKVVSFSYNLLPDLEGPLLMPLSLASPKSRGQSILVNSGPLESSQREKPLSFVLPTLE